MVGPKRRLLPGPDGSGRVRPPVAHVRSELPRTFSFAVEDPNEPDVEALIATRGPDAMIEFVTQWLAKNTGPGRLTTTATHNGVVHHVDEVDVVFAHRLVAGRMVESIELVDPNAPAPAPAPEPEGPRYA